jgi:hypothetical protein
MSIPRNTPQQVQDVPVLQWASGHTEARQAGEKRFAGHVGFHVERGKDQAFDAACERAGVAQVEIRHPRPGGHEIKAHWSFGDALRIHPITAGPPYQTISGCLKTAQTGEAGIGLAWPAGEKSRMAVRGLVLVGSEPMLVQLSVRSTMTSHLLAALVDHYRVCAAADAMIDRAKHPEPVMFHELSLPLVGGAEIAAGKGETALVTPLVSDHPQTIERAYIKSCWRRDAVHEAALTAWPGVVAWAMGYASGETNGDSHLDRPVEVTPEDDIDWTPPDRGTRPGQRRRVAVPESDLL